MTVTEVKPVLTVFTTTSLPGNGLAHALGEYMATGQI